MEHHVCIYSEILTYLKTFLFEADSLDIYIHEYICLGLYDAEYRIQVVWQYIQGVPKTWEFSDEFDIVF